MTTVTLELRGPIFWPGTRKKAERARALIEETLNLPAFQDAVRQAKFSDVRLLKPDGTTVENLTNEQILNVVLSGTEKGTQADEILQLRVQFHPFGSAVGEVGEDGIIHDLWWLFHRYPLADIAGHWLHEWCHTAGFRHDDDRTPRRPHSVPYLVGELLLIAAGGTPTEDEYAADDDGADDPTPAATT